MQKSRFSCDAAHFLPAIFELTRMLDYLVLSLGCVVYVGVNWVRPNILLIIIIDHICLKL